MIEIRGNLFDQKCDAIAITTNGYTNSRGENIMGGGCAGEAKKRWPGIDRVVGKKIQDSGNRVHLLTTELLEEEFQPYLRTKDGEYHPPYHLVSFPTKPDVVTDWDELLPRYQGQFDANIKFQAPGWMGHSKMDLIMCSAAELRELTNRMGWQRAVIPKVGSGLGGLHYEKQVRPILRKVLDDRFVVVLGG